MDARKANDATVMACYSGFVANRVFCRIYLRLKSSKKFGIFDLLAYLCIVKTTSFELNNKVK